MASSDGFDDFGIVCDVCVIGAGIAGCCTARELAAFDMSICVLDADNDVAGSTSRANSGIVHAGFDPMPGTLKAKFNVEGSRMYPGLAQELGFGFCNNGSMVLAFDEDGVESLKELVARGESNGVEDVHIVDGAEARRLEPNVSPDVVAALVAPTGGICDPYGVALAFAENAAANGVRFLFDTKVENVRRADEGAACADGADAAAAGSGADGAGADGAGWIVEARGIRVLARAVVNAAGLFADQVNAMVSEHRFDIEPRKGEYYILDTQYGQTFGHTMFQVPGSYGKGVLVTPTIHGNLLLGPNSVPQQSKTDLSTTREGLDFVVEHARRTWPQASQRGAITNFAGLRASGGDGDFIVGEAPDAPGFFNIACFDSPGLTSAPAVGRFVAGEIAKLLGAGRNASFEPRRQRPRLFANMSDEERADAIAYDPREGHVVCRCCNVNEAEIAAALHSPLPVTSLDAVKWRTGATMGRCHGGFCTPEIVRIMSRELGVRPEDIDKRHVGSWMFSSARADFVELAESDGDAGERLEIAEPCDGYRTEQSFDVVVLGGGAAGLAAAASARRAGARKVAVLDRELASGGVLRQCVHNGFGLRRMKEELTGPEYASRELEEAKAEDCTFVYGTAAMRIDSLDDGLKMVVAVRKGQEMFLHAGAVVIATGSRERGFGALDIVGTRPSGIYTAGCAQNLMNLHGCLPGKKVVILGSGDIGLIMARRMTLSEMNVLGVYEMMPFSSGLRRNIVQCLDDFGIPLHLSRTVTRVEGDARLEAVVVSDVDPATRRPIPGTEERIECDTLVLSCGLIPENEIAKTAGVELSAVTNGAVVDERLETSVPGIFACGNSLHVHDLADFASEEGERAGASAAAYAMRRTSPESAFSASQPTPAAATGPTISVVPAEGVRYVVPQKVHVGACGAGAGAHCANDSSASGDGALDASRASNADGATGRRAILSFRVDGIIESPRFIVEGVRSTDGCEPCSREVIVRKRDKIAVPAEMRRIEVDLSSLDGFERIEVRAVSSKDDDGSDVKGGVR